MRKLINNRAITVDTIHSQTGGEWKRVLIIHGSVNQPMTGGILNNYRYLYTALTRAKESCHLLVVNNQHIVSNV